LRVSVVINNYNYERYVGVAVQSALGQTYPDLEIIVVDDGSRDASLQVLKKFAASITLVAKENGGQGSAYNEGYRRSTGDIVIFLDADDWLYAQAVELVVAAFRPGVSKVQFPLDMVDRDGALLNRQVPREMSDADALELLQNFGGYNSPPGSGNAYASSFLRQVLPMPEAPWRIAADTVPILLAPAYGEIVSIREPLGAYRLHKRDAGALLMNNAPADLWEEYRRIEQSKNFVKGHLSALGRKFRDPMLLAPWEARVVALCVRFGARTGELASSRGNIGWFALRSLWAWPNWSVKRKLLQSVWMFLVFFMPKDIARHWALKHKALAGRPSDKTA
jgi:glycosyltransferase involved in cell wall biosynthesis